MGKLQLEKSYRDTTYVVYMNGKNHDIYIDKSIPLEIQQQLSSSKQQTAAIITACNPKSQVLSKEENKSLNIKLHDSLLNYSVFNALGKGADMSWPAEESYFILGIKKEEAEVLAVEYDQYAYVWLENNKKPSLIFSKIW